MRNAANVGVAEADLLSAMSKFGYATWAAGLAIVGMVYGQFFRKGRRPCIG